MEANNDSPSRANRFLVDGMPKTNIVEWNKKRKLPTDQLDFLRPKHKCWVQSLSSEHVSMFDENLQLTSMHAHVIKLKADTAFQDNNRSESESAKDSNSFAEESDTSMSVNQEAKFVSDCAKTRLCSIPSTSYGNWLTDKVKDIDDSLDGSMVEKTASMEEESSFVDSEYHPIYCEADIQTLHSIDEHVLGIGSHSNHLGSACAKDCCEECIDKEFEDILFSNGVKPNMYVLSSGRWGVNQEAESSARPPTIDQEFEQYFSMLML